MKKFKRLSVGLIMLFAMCMFSGCVHMKADMEVDKKGNADLSLVYATMVTDENADISEENAAAMKALEQKGWKAEPYKEEGYAGYSATLNGVALSDIEKNIDGTSLGDITVTKSGKKYVIDWEMLDEEDRASIAEAGSAISTYGGYMKFELTLPKEATSSNATSVSSDGKTLTWDLLSMSDKSIQVEFSLGSPMTTIFIIFALFAVVAVVIVLVMNASKKKAQVVDATVTTEASEVVETVEASQDTEATEATETAEVTETEEVEEATENE